MPPSVLKNLFILCEPGTKANIGGAKMANNRHAVNRNFLQSYWMSDELSLYSSQTAWEKTHPNQHWKTSQDPEDHMQHRSVKTGHCIAWSDGYHSQLALFWKDNGYQIDVCQQEQWGTVWNQQNWSQGE
jgi:hypothetical protein